MNPLLGSRHIQHQALFSLKDKSEKIKVLSAAILLGSLRVQVFGHLKIMIFSSPEPKAPGSL